MKILREPAASNLKLIGMQDVDLNKSYRLLSFCIVETERAITAICNPLTGEIIALDEKEAEVLRSKDIFDFTFAEDLIKRWFFVPSDSDDRKLCDDFREFGRMVKGFDNDLSAYTIFTTTDCNARCFYCFELGCTPKTMTLKTAHDVAQFIIKSSKSKKVTIGWFGGEPLLNIAAIDTIISALSSAGIEYTSSMISNGYLFADEVVEKAVSQWRLKKIQITLDGTEKVYNDTKAYIYDNGLSAFSVVLNNIERLLNAGVHVLIRLNLGAHNAKDLSELINQLATRFSGYSNVSVYTIPLFEFDKEAFVDPVRIASRRALFEEKARLDDLCLEKGILSLKKLPKGIKLNRCMVDSPRAVTIMPEGQLGKCEHYVDDHFVGDIYKGITDTSVMDSLAKHKKLGELCDGCVAYPSCCKIEGCPTDGTVPCDEMRRSLEEKRYRVSLKKFLHNFLVDEEQKLKNRVYTIAGFNIGIKTQYRYFTQVAEAYVAEDQTKSDFFVEATENEIKSSLNSEDLLDETVGAKRLCCEQTIIHSKICAEILKHDAFMMHGAVIEYEGKGYLFTAKSGTGKTTHIRLWKKLFGEDKVTIVNGDKPILRFLDGKVYAYGTPWCGKEGYNTNTRVPLAAICFLERGEINSIKKISDIEAIPRIFSQIMIHDSADLAKQMELVDKLFEKVPTYLLKCNMDVDAARVAYEGMN